MSDGSEGYSTSTDECSDAARALGAALREPTRKERKLVERDIVTRVIAADTRERD